MRPFLFFRNLVQIGESEYDQGGIAGVPLPSK